MMISDLPWLSLNSGFCFDSPYKAQANWAQVVNLGKMAKGADPEGDRAEFVKLAEQAQLLADKKK